MQESPAQQTPWRHSAFSEGLTVISEEDSLKSSDFSSEPGQESRLGSRKDEPQHHRSPVQQDNHDADAITTVGSLSVGMSSPRYSPWSGHVQQFMDSFFAHDNSTTSDTTVYSESRSLTDKTVRLGDHISIVIGPPVILLLDLVVPCAIYYSWLDVERRKWRTGGEQGPIPTYNHHIMGLSIISFGVGELYILIVRVVRLIRDPDSRPLLSTHWWELDATSWVYGVALLIALVPFVSSTTARAEVIPWLYLYPPGCLMAFLGILSAITLIPFKTPVKINSEPAGSFVRPLVYYAAEDFIAVDGFQGRDFRKRYRARYDKNPRFRRFILHLTLFWITGICLYHTLLASVVWTVPFEYAFGISLGILFSWIATWAVITIVWVRRTVDSEKQKARLKKGGEVESNGGSDEYNDRDRGEIASDAHA